MQIKIRDDLGGYAANLPSLAAARSGIAVTKPFVLLLGPNGSGKTSLLRMLRAAIGLEGVRAGHAPSCRSFTHMLTREQAVDTASGRIDLARLTAFRRSGRLFGEDEHRLARDLPGVLDVRALGWQGERTWFYQARAVTEQLSAPELDRIDTRAHVRLLVDGKNASHGQALRGEWADAVEFAIGLLPASDAYDQADLWQRVPALAALQQELGLPPSPQSRPARRWLLLDEPETTLDAQAFAVGLSALLAQCAQGDLQVFCASHSFLFAAGFADHSLVQVVDLGQAEGSAPGAGWLATTRAAIALAADPTRMLVTGQQVLADMQEADRQAREAAVAARRQLLDKTVRQLSDSQRRALLAALANGGQIAAGAVVAGKKIQSATVRALSDGLDRDCRLLSRRGIDGGELTKWGLEVAGHLRQSISAIIPSA